MLVEVKCNCFIKKTIMNVDDVDDMLVAERILAERLNEDNHLQYLIQWKDEDEDYNTWESYNEVSTEWPDLLKQFNNKNNENNTSRTNNKIDNNKNIIKQNDKNNICCKNNKNKLLITKNEVIKENDKNDNIEDVNKINIKKGNKIECKNKSGKESLTISTFSYVIPSSYKKEQIASKNDFISMYRKCIYIFLYI